MRIPQTRTIMEMLRQRNRLVVRNNKKIDIWVDDYIDECILNGRPVEILTQWCSGLGLKARMEQQGGRFQPYQDEIDLIQKQIPRIINTFTSQGVLVSWIITFNRSYIARRRLPDGPFLAYMAMIQELARGNDVLEKCVMFLDWTEYERAIRPSADVTERFGEFVSANAIDYEVRSFMQMLRQYPDALESEEELRKEAETRIAYESEEARFLTSTEAPFSDGKFTLVPLEKPERYVFFDIRVPGFTKRIASVVTLYPWR